MKNIFLLSLCFGLFIVKTANADCTSAQADKLTLAKIDDRAGIKKVSSSCIHGPEDMCVSYFIVEGHPYRPPVAGIYFYGIDDGCPNLNSATIKSGTEQIFAGQQ